MDIPDTVVPLSVGDLALLQQQFPDDVILASSYIIIMQLISIVMYYNLSMIAFLYTIDISVRVLFVVIMHSL